jgi:hypothetical protein
MREITKRFKTFKVMFSLAFFLFFVCLFVGICVLISPTVVSNKLSEVCEKKVIFKKNRLLLLIDFLRSGIVGFVGFMMFALISLFTPELVVKSVSNEIEKVSKEKCPGFYELYLAGLI